MASSLASIAETWPENVLTSIGSRKSLSRKIIARPYLSLKGCQDHRRGCKPPLYKDPTIWVLKARKIFRPYRASFLGGFIYRGLTPPAVFLSPLRGYYILSRSHFRSFPIFVLFVIFFRGFSELYRGWIDFLRICAIFCRYWTCTFSGRNDQAIGPRSSAIFTLP